MARGEVLESKWTLVEVFGKALKFFPIFMCFSFLCLSFILKQKFLDFESCYTDYIDQITSILMFFCLLSFKDLHKR